jgi:hypothetical protein
LNRWAILFRPAGLRNATLLHRLVHGQQDEPFLVAGDPRHRGFIRQVAFQDPLLHQATALMLVRQQRPDHGLRVGVDALRLKQHPTAERQLPHHARPCQQRQHRAQFLVGEPLELAGQPQLQRLAQFVETQLAGIGSIEYNQTCSLAPA